MDYEAILESIHMVSKSVTEKLGYDKTVLATVMDIAGDKYLVSDSSSQFYAISSNGKAYEINETVYVTIPNGNYSNDKYIIGSASKDGSKLIYKDFNIQEGFEYITYRNVSENSYGLLANGMADTAVIYESKEPLDNHDKWYLCIAGDFNTSIPGVVEGSYGLRLILNTEEEEQQTYELDSSIMTGPIYQQNVTQGVFYFIENSAINGYRLEFYQNGNFLYEDGTPISYEGINNERYTNIKLNNAGIYIGEVADIEDQFLSKHYDKINNNTGLVAGKRQTEGGIYNYDEKEMTFSLTNQGIATLGAPDIGGFKFNGEKSRMMGEIEFNVTREGEKTITYKPKRDDYLTFYGALIEEEAIKNSKNNIEDVVFKDFFDIVWERNYTNIYYWNPIKGDDSNSGHLETEAFLTFEPIKKILQSFAKEINIVLCCEGDYDISAINSFSNINIDFIIGKDVKKDINIINRKNLKINKSNFNLSGTDKIRINFIDTIETNNSYVSCNYCNFTEINLNGTMGEFNNCSINKLAMDNNSVKFLSCSLDVVKAENCNNVFSNCSFYNKEIAGQQGRIHLNSSNTIIQGSNTRIYESAESESMQYLFFQKGGWFSIITEPIISVDNDEKKYEKVLKSLSGILMTSMSVKNKLMELCDCQKLKDAFDFSECNIFPTQKKGPIGTNGGSSGTFPVYTQQYYGGSIGTCGPTTAAVVISGLKGAVSAVEVCDWIKNALGWDGSAGYYTHEHIKAALNHYGVSYTDMSSASITADIINQGAVIALVHYNPWREAIGQPYPIGGDHYVTLHDCNGDTVNYVDTSTGISGTASLSAIKGTTAGTWIACQG